MKGVRVGTGSIIAIGSIVTKDVASYSIVAGVPAKFIKMRFEEDQLLKDIYKLNSENLKG